MCFSVLENIALQIRLITAFMFCYSSLTELFEVESNRQNTTSILLNGVHLFAHFISWFSAVGYLHIPIKYLYCIFPSFNCPGQSDNKYFVVGSLNYSERTQ